MNLYVCLKQVPDTETKIKLNSSLQGIDPTGIKWIISPYDEFAIEEALRIKEKHPGSSLTVLSAGPSRVVEALRTALALGADEGIHVDVPEIADSFLIAKALAAALKNKPIDFIFTGKEAIDDGASQVSGLLSEFLNIPCMSVVQQIEYREKTVLCKREIEGGAFEMIESSLPVLIAAQKGLNEPRIATIPNIMKAKKKSIQTLTLASLGISENQQKIKYTHFQLPPPKPPGKKLAGELSQQVQQLVQLLHEEAKVI